jgi:hypothetical protein
MDCMEGKGGVHFVYLDRTLTILGWDTIVQDMVRVGERMKSVFGGKRHGES